jgi:hypothetical protein
VAHSAVLLSAEIALFIELSGMPLERVRWGAKILHTCQETAGASVNGLTIIRPLIAKPPLRPYGGFDQNAGLP